MVTVELFTKEECSLCDKVREVILSARRVHPFEFVEVNIARDPRLLQRYGEEIPVVRIDGKDAFRYRLSERALIKKVVRAEKRKG
jgi:predicted DCC family thiol-disulfide oxidoreductase YuxK